MNTRSSGLCAGWLDGVTPSADAFLDDSASVSLASFVRALHAVEFPDGPEARRGAPLVVQDTGTRAAIDHLSDVYDAEVLTQLWDDALAVPPWDRAHRCGYTAISDLATWFSTGAAFAGRDRLRWCGSR